MRLRGPLRLSVLGVVAFVAVRRVALPTDTKAREEPKAVPEGRLCVRVVDGDTIELEGGKRVRFEYDIERRDRYGRTLAYVWVGDVLVNERLVELGFAQVSTYPPNVRYVDRFLAAQRRAREAGAGLWGR